MKRRNKPAASVSLDLDNQWSYMKIHGDKDWEKYPSYLDIFIPHILKLLDDQDLKITFFIVGKDAEINENGKYLRMITDHGHEVGNHSHNHESWLQTYNFSETEKEIRLAEKAILEATGQKPIGFRGPGFSWSENVFKVLGKSGYLYDASTFPTFIGPFARMYYFRKSGLSRNEKRSRKELFGKFSEGFQPLKPYLKYPGTGNKILEIPVTTIPLFKIPFHLSYLIYLSGYSFFLMKVYLSFALVMCRLTGVKPSFLLHPLDIISGDKVPQLAFFPGMEMNTGEKIRIFKYVLTKLKKNYTLVQMNQFADITLDELHAKKFKK